MGEAPSLFRRLRRYSATPGRDPREDRLTEALCATLAAAPEAARDLVAAAFPDVDLPDAPLLVDTQERAGGLRRADLQILFGEPRCPSLRVWFEAKVSSPAYREQGEIYIAELRRRQRADGAPWMFAWLLPVGADVDGGTPERTAVLTWQRVTSVLHEWVGGRDHDDRHGTVMARELVRDLEEEQLGRAHPLTREDALALNRHHGALAAAAELVRQAGDIIASRWGSAPIYEGGPSRDPLWFWRHYPNHGPGRPQRWPPPDQCWFEWHGRRDEARRSPKGEIVLGAGVVFHKGRAPREDRPADRRWLERYFARGFEYGSAGPRDEYVFLFRYLTLDELTVEADLAAQADRLATFTVDTWTALAADPVDPSMLGDSDPPA